MYKPTLFTSDNTLPIELLDMDAEKARLAMLRGRRVLIVMASYQGKLPMYQRAQELGIEMVVLDGPGHWAPTYVASGLFKAFIEVDLRDNGTRLERALSAIYNSGFQFDAVATFQEFAISLTAQIAEALGLPGQSIEAVTNARSKYETRKVCCAAGLPTPRYARISSFADLTMAAQNVGFPAVLKPIAGSASSDVFYVDNIQMLEQRYQQIMTIQRHASRNNQLNSDSNHMIELVWLQGFDMVLEEFLDGDEFDIDCLLSRGEMVYASVTEETPQPQMTETGAYLPANYPLDKQAELVDLSRQVLAALGFEMGVFHIEAKYTSNGPRLLEVNARLAGGLYYKMNKLVWGVDLVDQYLMTCLDIPICPQKANPPITYLASSDLVAPYSGTITHANFLDYLKVDPRVALIDDHTVFGQSVNGPERGVPDTLGEIVTCGGSVEVAYQALQDILANLRLPIQPEGIPLHTGYEKKVGSA